jgi:deoxyadenosine/deoxycytidine kinase
MMEYLKPPDLMIYLRANVTTLKAQIAKRGRSYEQSISTEYLGQLNRHYESWIENYKLGPLAVIESDDLDFVHNPDDFVRVEEMVRRKLKQ